MSLVGWDHQALDSIQSALGHTDPKLASMLATFTRLAASEQMPAHEKVRSPLGHPPRRHRSRPRAWRRWAGTPRSPRQSWPLSGDRVLRVLLGRPRQDARRYP